MKIGSCVPPLTEIPQHTHAEWAMLGVTVRFPTPDGLVLSQEVGLPRSARMMGYLRDHVVPDDSFVREPDSDSES